MKNFISPHIHIASFDAASTPEKFAQRELELGTGYVTITDHGTLEGVRRVYDLCNKEYKGKLKPIIGLEGYFRDDNCTIIDPSYKIDGSFKEYLKYTHITMHMMDHAAYSATSRILSMADSRAEQHGSERKPLFTWDNLEELGSYNISMTSGCLIGIVGRHILKNNDFETAEKYYQKVRSTAKPGNFYVEIFPHTCDKNYEVATFFTYEDGTEDKFPVWKNLKTKKGEAIKAQILCNQINEDPSSLLEHQSIVEVMTNRRWNQVADPKKIVRARVTEGFLQNPCSDWCPNGDVQAGINRFLIKMAQKYGDKILWSDDSHFAYPNEYQIQNIRLASKDSDKGVSGTWRFANSHHRLDNNDLLNYIKHNMPEITNKQFEEWVVNSHEWASKFDSFKFNNPTSIPTKFFPKDTIKHTMDIIRQKGRMDWSNTKMTERLKAEIDLLYSNGTIDLLPYFFIDVEATDLYEKSGVLTGPGRGSAAGLILTYLLGITHVNPLDHDLSMDRFLTLDRIKSGKLPDIDTDFPDRELLVKEVPEWEIELEDGSSKSIPSGTLVETPEGKVTIDEAIKQNYSIKLI